MSADFTAQLWALAYLALGGLAALVRVLQLELRVREAALHEAVADAAHAARRAENNTNGKLEALVAENVRLRLEIEQLYATIHSRQE